MPLAVPANEKPCPVGAELFGTEAIVLTANPLPYLVQEACSPKLGVWNLTDQFMSV